MLPPKRMRIVAFASIAAASIDRRCCVEASSAIQLKNAADYEVKRSLLEGSYPAYTTFRGKMHAGLMPAASAEDGGDDYSSYFFWLFRPDDDATDDGRRLREKDNHEHEERPVEAFRNDTLLVWFNGGPGCSSMVGLMGEMGPVGTPKFGPGISAPNPDSAIDAPLVENVYAWTKKSAMLFVEQPGGTGFSTASSQWVGEDAEERTEEDVAEAFWHFLQNIYKVFGNELGEKKLYLSGESYAGMYVPSIAHGIHQRNKRVLAKQEGYRSPTTRIVNLRGLAIGNGWIDPIIQGPTTIDYAWWHGMIDLQTYRGLHSKWDQCVAREITDSSDKPFHPFTTPDECGISVAVMKASGSKFMYDVTTYDAYPSVLDKKGTVGNFFNDPIVRESLNAPPLSEHPFWQACVPGSGRRRRRRRLEEDATASLHPRRRELILLDNDRPLSVVPYIAELLDDAKLDILMYNGDLDLACAPQSTELALESMDWSGKLGWMDPGQTHWHEWHVDGQASGRTKSYKNLNFLVVYNSGHFVPINQARNALNMIGRLIDGKTMGDKELPVFPVRQEDKTKEEVDEGKTPEEIVVTDGSRDAAPGKEKKGFAFLPGLYCFVLGMVSYHFISKRMAATRHKQLNNMSSSASSPEVFSTEATPLHHSGTV